MTVSQACSGDVAVTLPPDLTCVAPTEVTFIPEVSVTLLDIGCLFHGGLLTYGQVAGKAGLNVPELPEL